MDWFMQIIQSRGLLPPPVSPPFLPPAPPPSQVAVLYPTLSGFPSGDSKDTSPSAKISMTTFLKAEICNHFDGTQGS